MAGEHILVVEPMLATLEFCRSLLEREGFNVTVAANAAAALGCPDFANVDMVLVNSTLDGISVLDMIRTLRSVETTTFKPILLMVPETAVNPAESIESFSAQGWILTPFEPEMLIAKIRRIIEAQRSLGQEREMLRQQAIRMTKSITEEALAKGIETHMNALLMQAKTQADKELQRLVSSQLENTEYELTADKIKLITQTVAKDLSQKHLEELTDLIARQTVQKLLLEMVPPAVSVAIDDKLPETANRVVMQQAERELPKMVQDSVQKAAEMIVPITSEKAVSIIEGVSNRLLPKLAADAVQKATEHYVVDTLERQVPTMVNTQVGAEINNAIQERVRPITQKAVSTMNRRLFLLAIIMCILMLGMLVLAGIRLNDKFLQIRNQQNSEIIGENPFDWLLK